MGSHGERRTWVLHPAPRVETDKFASCPVLCVESISHQSNRGSTLGSQLTTDGEDLAGVDGVFLFYSSP